VIINGFVEIFNVININIKENENIFELDDDVDNKEKCIYVKYK